MLRRAFVAGLAAAVAVPGAAARASERKAWTWERAQQAREIFPNVLSSLTVVATVEMANAILLEAALSFLGFGVQAPTPSWGLMLNEGREYMFFSPWLVALPGACLFVLVLAINLFGDGLRDVTLERER